MRHKRVGGWTRVYHRVLQKRGLGCAKKLSIIILHWDLVLPGWCVVPAAVAEVPLAHGVGHVARLLQVVRQQRVPQCVVYIITQNGFNIHKYIYYISTKQRVADLGISLFIYQTVEKKSTYSGYCYFLWPWSVYISSFLERLKHKCLD